MKFSFFGGNGTASPEKITREVEEAMDPSKRVKIKHIVGAEIIDNKTEDKTLPENEEEVVVQNESYGESPIFKMPKDVLDYLDRLIKKPGPGRLSGPITVLKYHIEDESSLPEVLSKIEKAKNTSVLSNDEFKAILDMLGVRDNSEVIQEDIKIGQYVNLSLSDGEFAWSEPRRVRGIHKKNRDAYVDGSDKPFPLEDLMVFPAPEGATKGKKPPPEVKNAEVEPEKIESVDDKEIFKVGDEVVIEGEKKIIKKIDKDWVELIDGPIIARSEFEGKIGSKPLSDEDDTFVGPMPEKATVDPKDDDTFFGPLPETKKPEPADDTFVGPMPEIKKPQPTVDDVFVGPMPENKLDKDIIISDFDVNKIYDYIRVTFDSAFDEKDYWESNGVSIDKVPDDEKNKLSLILKKILESGKLKKVGDKYVANKVDDTFVGPMPEKATVDPKDDDTFFGPLPETKKPEPADDTFVGPMPEVKKPEPITDDTFVGPMPEKVPAVPLDDNTFVGPRPEWDFVGPLKEDLTEKEKMGDVRFNLKQAQDRYALSQVNYRKKNSENSKWMTKIREGLGIQKTTAEVLSKVTPKNIEDEVKEMGLAQTEYIAAKKARMMEIVKAPVTPEEIAKHGLESLSNEEKVSAIYKIRAVEQAENEWNSLQKKIVELTPTQEKGRIMKALESWSKKPLVVRLGALPILIGVAIAIAPGLGFAAGGIAAGTAYAGVRAARGVGGYFGAKYAGKGFDTVMDKKNIKTHKENTDEYGEYVKNEDDFEELEKHDMENREKEAKSKQQQRIAKAVVMMGAGAGVGIATGYAESLASNAVFPGAGHVDVTNAPSVKPVGFWQGLKNRFVDQDGPDAPKAPSAPKDTIMNYKTGMLKADGAKIENLVENPVKVELSSRGFIQTIDDMKSKLKAQYPDEAKMPEGVKSFLGKPSTKLAQDYGFYDPTKGTSGMGLKGESLTLDSKGNLKMEHLDGKTEIIDAGDNKFHGPKIIHKEVATPETTHEITSEADVGPAQPETVTPVVEVGSEQNDYFSAHPDQNTPETIISPRTHIPPPPPTPDLSEYIPKKPISANSFDLSIDNKTFHVDVSTIEGHKQVLIDGVKVAEQVTAPKGSGGEVLQLLDKYQDGKVYSSIRQAFTQARIENGIFENMKIPKDAIITGTAFENGRIDVLHGVGDNKDAVSVFLNGKEIAKGLVTDKGPQVKIHSNLKGGLFLADTVYERAFKQASPLIKAIKK